MTNSLSGVNGAGSTAQSHATNTQDPNAYAQDWHEAMLEPHTNYVRDYISYVGTASRGMQDTFLTGNMDPRKYKTDAGGGYQGVNTSTLDGLRRQVLDEVIQNNFLIYISQESSSTLSMVCFILMGEARPDDVKGGMEQIKKSNDKVADTMNKFVSNLFQSVTENNAKIYANKKRDAEIRNNAKTSGSGKVKAHFDGDTDEINYNREMQQHTNEYYLVSRQIFESYQSMTALSSFQSSVNSGFFGSSGTSLSNHIESMQTSTRNLYRPVTDPMAPLSSTGGDRPYFDINTDQLVQLGAGIQNMGAAVRGMTMLRMRMAQMEKTVLETMIGIKTGNAIDIELTMSALENKLQAISTDFDIMTQSLSLTKDLYNSTVDFNVRATILEREQAAKAAASALEIFFSILGAVVGAVLGGPVGAAIGGAIGSAVGQAVGNGIRQGAIIEAERNTPQTINPDTVLGNMASFLLMIRGYINRGTYSQGNTPIGSLGTYMARLDQQEDTLYTQFNNPNGASSFQVGDPLYGTHPSGSGDNGVWIESGDGRRFVNYKKVDEIRKELAEIQSIRQAIFSLTMAMVNLERMVTSVIGGLPTANYTGQAAKIIESQNNISNQILEGIMGDMKDIQAKFQFNYKMSKAIAEACMDLAWKMFPMLSPIGDTIKNSAANPYAAQNANAETNYQARYSTAQSASQIAEQEQLNQLGLMESGSIGFESGSGRGVNETLHAVDYRRADQVLNNLKRVWEVRAAIAMLKEAQLANYKSFFSTFAGISFSGAGLLTQVANSQNQVAFKQFSDTLQYLNQVASIKNEQARENVRFRQAWVSIVTNAALFFSGMGIAIPIVGPAMSASISRRESGGLDDPHHNTGRTGRYDSAVAESQDPEVQAIMREMNESLISQEAGGGGKQVISEANLVLLTRRLDAFFKAKMEIAKLRQAQIQTRLEMVSTLMGVNVTKMGSIQSAMVSLENKAANQALKMEFQSIQSLVQRHNEKVTAEENFTFTMINMGVTLVTSAIQMIASAMESLQAALQTIARSMESAAKASTTVAKLINVFSQIKDAIKSVIKPLTDFVSKALGKLPEKLSIAIRVLVNGVGIPLAKQILPAILAYSITEKKAGGAREGRQVANPNAGQETSGSQGRAVRGLAGMDAAVLLQASADSAQAKRYEAQALADSIKTEMNRRWGDALKSTLVSSMKNIVQSVNAAMNAKVTQQQRELNDPLENTNAATLKIEKTRLEDKLKDGEVRSPEQLDEIHKEIKRLDTQIEQHEVFEALASDKTMDLEKLKTEFYEMHKFKVLPNEAAFKEVQKKVDQLARENARLANDPTAENKAIMVRNEAHIAGLREGLQRTQGDLKAFLAEEAGVAISKDMPDKQRATLSDSLAEGKFQEFFDATGKWSQLGRNSRGGWGSDSVYAKLKTLKAADDALKSIDSSLATTRILNAKAIDASTFDLKSVMGNISAMPWEVQETAVGNLMRLANKDPKLTLSLTEQFVTMGTRGQEDFLITLNRAAKKDPEVARLSNKFLADIPTFEGAVSRTQLTLTAQNILNNKNFNKTDSNGNYRSGFIFRMTHDSSPSVQTGLDKLASLAGEDSKTVIDGKYLDVSAGTFAEGVGARFMKEQDPFLLNTTGVVDTAGALKQHQKNTEAVFENLARWQVGGRSLEALQKLITDARAEAKKKAATAVDSDGSPSSSTAAAKGQPIAEEPEAPRADSATTRANELPPGVRIEEVLYDGRPSEAEPSQHATVGPVPGHSGSEALAKVGQPTARELSDESARRAIEAARQAIKDENPNFKYTEHTKCLDELSELITAVVAANEERVRTLFSLAEDKLHDIQIKSSSHVNAELSTILERLLGPMENAQRAVYELLDAAGFKVDDLRRDRLILEETNARNALAASSRADIAKIFEEATRVQEQAARKAMEIRDRKAVLTTQTRELQANYATLLEKTGSGISALKRFLSNVRTLVSPQPGEKKPDVNELRNKQFNFAENSTEDAIFVHAKATLENWLEIQKLEGKSTARTAGSAAAKK